MEEFEWKENANTIFGRRCNIEQGEKKLYLLLTYQCKLSINTKLKFTKGYDKPHNAQCGIKLMGLIKSFVCGVEEHLQGTWATMNSGKHVYKFVQRRKKKNDDNMKYFDDYVKVIKSYRGRTPIKSRPVNAKIANMGVQDTKNTTTEEQAKVEGGGSRRII